jgi:hypothetical protein
MWGYVVRVKASISSLIRLILEKRERDERRAGRREISLDPLSDQAETARLGRRQTVGLRRSIGTLKS